MWSVGRDNSQRVPAAPIQYEDAFSPCIRLAPVNPGLMEERVGPYKVPRIGPTLPIRRAQVLKEQSLGA